MMLEYSPKLQNLIIQDLDKANDKYWTDLTVEKYWMDPTMVPVCLSTQLKTCCIRGYKGTKFDLKFAKYIIENSKVLDTMTINSISSMDINEKHQMLVKLSSYTKGSTTCNFLFD
ncbi:unnamed protein product [Trifolium pratense]|uniref:Uncharacterized protein n=1 Tax=Trifolium pratense TaxID=57577 RepID=A0ACB0J577_TRIPR|nr:unnamed protein product [Trifolium pratense]